MPRILLVEDEEPVRSLLKEVLEGEGYETREASNGQEALNIQASFSADLVLTDIVMPDMEGIEMIIRIRKSDPNVKIIVMSGNNYLDLARKLGADHALRKPFSNQVLVDAVKATLELNRH